MRNGEDRVYSCGSSLMHRRLWSPSRSLYIGEVATCPQSRVSSLWKKTVAEKIILIRKKTVMAFKSSRVKVAANYVAVARDKYEKQYPGRIVRKGLKTDWLNTADGLRDCVLLRKTPKDTYDVEISELSGVQVEEIHDDSSTVIRKNQADKKYEALAGSSRGLATSANKNQTIDSDVESERSEAEHGASGDSGKGSDDSDDDTMMAGGSGLLNAGSRICGASPLLTPIKKGKAKGAAPPQHAGKLTASPASKFAQVKPQLESKRNPQPDEASETRVVRGRMTFGVKHAGKTAMEILEQHGFAEIQQSVEEVVATWGKPPFNTAVLGEDFIEFKESCTQLKKQTLILTRNIRLLHNKVSKWKDIPDGVMQMTRLWRNKVMTMYDTLVQFDLSSSKGGDASKMENCMACLASYSIDTPNAMQVIFFREKSVDMARWGMVDELVDFMDVHAGQLSDLHKTELSFDVDSVYAEVIAECLATLLSNTIKDFNSVMGMLRDFTGKLSRAEVGIEPSTRTELAEFAVALGYGGHSAADCQAARIAVVAKVQDGSYAGVLKLVADTEMWGQLFLDTTIVSGGIEDFTMLFARSHCLR